MPFLAIAATNSFLKSSSRTPQPDVSQTATEDPQGLD
jgi:hypothetical protein